MPKIYRKRVVPHTADQMYDLVNDIESYPLFIPWCMSSRVLSRTCNEVSASLSFSKGGMQKSFSTKNTLLPPHSIEMTLLEGPFKYLKGIWSFSDLAEGGCEVVFDLNFEFSNRILAMMFGPVFNHVAQSLVRSFSDHANSRYA